jgi:hypothetical protein
MVSVVGSTREEVEDATVGGRATFPLLDGDVDGL